MCVRMIDSLQLPLAFANDDLETDVALHGGKLQLRITSTVTDAEPTVLATSNVSNSCIDCRYLHSTAGTNTLFSGRLTKKNGAVFRAVVASINAMCDANRTF